MITKGIHRGIDFIETVAIRERIASAYIAMEKETYDVFIFVPFKNQIDLKRLWENFCILSHK